MFEIFALLPPTELAAPYILEWHHRHFSVITDDISEKLREVEALSEPEQDPVYWDLLYKFAMVGLNDYVRKLLLMHSAWKYVFISSFCLILDQRPVFGSEA